MKSSLEQNAIERFMKPIHSFHSTWQGYLVFGIIEGGLTYLFLSLAIDTGSLLYWVLTVCWLIGVVQNFWNAAAVLLKRKTVNGH